MTQDECSATLNKYSLELSGILSRFVKTKNSILIASSDRSRFEEIGVELIDLFRDEFVDGGRHAELMSDRLTDTKVRNYYGSPSYFCVESVRSIVNAVLARVSRSAACLKGGNGQMQAPSATQRVEALFRVGERFHQFARQLRNRRENRSTLDVKDEYDVKDLFHALLKISFDDVRPEEWTPSYAGGASRMDFSLPEIEAVVEIKKSRPGLGARELGEQLIVDIVKYKQHPSCRTLFCFVYDPDGRIHNPRGIENDLNANQTELTVRVLIAP